MARFQWIAILEPWRNAITNWNRRREEKIWLMLMTISASILLSTKWFKKLSMLFWRYKLLDRLFKRLGHCLPRKCNRLSLFLKGQVTSILDLYLAVFLACYIKYPTSPIERSCCSRMEVDYARACSRRMSSPILYQPTRSSKQTIILKTEFELELNNTLRSCCKKKRLTVDGEAKWKIPWI